MIKLDKIINDRKFYNAVFDTLSICFFKYEVQKRRVLLPEKTRKMFGGKEHYDNMPFSLAEYFVAPDYREEFISLFEDCREGKEEGECIIEDKGRQFLLWIKLQIVEKAEDGTPLLAVGIIDNQKRLRRQLQKQKVYSDAILANAVGYFEFNLSRNEIVGELVDSRKEKVEQGTVIPAADRTKAGFNEFQNWWAETSLASDKEEYLKISNCDYLISCYEKGMRVVNVACRSITYTGDITDNKETYYLSADPFTGDIIGICVMYDLTTQHTQERVMHRQEQIIRKLGDKFDAICAVNLDKGSIVDYQIDEVLNSADYLNERKLNYWERVENFAKLRVLKEEREMFIKALQPEVIREKIQDKGRYHVDFRIWKDNAVHYYRCRVIRDNYEKKDCAIIMAFLNVDEEMEQHRLLEETLRYAEHASKAKTSFLSNMSHDMRTPMNAIIGYTALAAANLDNKEKTQEYLKKIASSGNHLLSLINDILDMSRIESGKVVLNESPENLAEILHDLRIMVQPQIHAKQMDFFIDTCDVRDELIYCDKIRLKQVLLNIFSNSVKYTEPGGTVSVRIIQNEKQTREYGNYEFHIKDTGRGMTPEFLEHIFEPFAREEIHTSDINPGTGLGLSIVKNIIDMMNGKIEVKSTVGKGSEFIISLTFKLQNSKQAEYDFSQIAGFRALVVDDDFHTCDTVTRMLREIGMRPEFTMHGKEAVLKARQAYELEDEFFVYIIDWMMPDMNGIEVVRRIRKEIGNSAPIIILTAYDWEGIREEAKEAGVTAICEKPLFMSNLKKIIAQSCGWEESSNLEKKAAEVDFHGKKLMLAEDIEINQEIAYEILTEKGFEVTIVDNGKQAVEALANAAEGEYDLVLMDIRMPYMNGYEATEAIRKMDSSYKDIPIVAMTANAFEDDRQMSFRAGMNEHISKPLDEKHLFSVLAEILSS